MVTQTTSGITISVECIYQEEYSNPSNMHYMFAYRITIENNSPYTTQLINRHWDIYDAIGAYSQVDGPGVVGNQPVLSPGKSHQYVSGCNLKSEFGHMHGYYTMRREIDGELFEVEIPKFNLIASYKLN